MDCGGDGEVFCGVVGGKEVVGGEVSDEME